VAAALCLSCATLQIATACCGWCACRWALLYTLPDAAKGDVKRSPLNTAMAAAYDFFYR
jgi:hypothetical protein